MRREYEEVRVLGGMLWLSARRAQQLNKQVNYGKLVA